MLEADGARVAKREAVVNEDNQRVVLLLSPIGRGKAHAFRIQLANSYRDLRDTPWLAGQSLAGLR